MHDQEKPQHWERIITPGILRNKARHGKRMGLAHKGA